MGHLVTQMEPEPLIIPKITEKRSSKRRKIDLIEEKPKEEEKEIISRHFCCFFDECKEICKNLDVLDGHFLEFHQLKKYKCLLGDCGQSFDQK